MERAMEDAKEVAMVVVRTLVMVAARKHAIEPVNNFRKERKIVEHLFNQVNYAVGADACAPNCTDTCRGECVDTCRGTCKGGSRREIHIHLG